MKILKLLAMGTLLASLTNCFSIMHFLDLQENGTLNVQWSFRFSKALEDMGKKGDKAESGGLSQEVEKGKQELPGKLGSIAKDLKVETLQSDYDSGIRMSFAVPQYLKLDFSKFQEAEFPYMPRYDAAKKQMIFHFTPAKKDKKEEKPAETKMPDAPKEGSEETSEPATQGGDDMGKQIGKLFLSSVRYQIVLGKNLKVKSVSVSQDGVEKKLELQTIGEQSMIDLPLFALYGDKELPFDLIVQLK